MQVNFLPEVVDVEPTFVQAAPALTAPNAGITNNEPNKLIETTRAKNFFMAKMVLSP